MSETYRSDLFLAACRRQPVDTTPIWIMRQAGRYLPEYRAVRETATFREMLARPELAAEVTLQPLRRFELDAGIIFSDILITTEAMGVPFEIVKGTGPVLERTVRTRADIDGLRTAEPEADLPHLLEAIRQVTAELNGRIPLIGFAGAPFTLACYLVEGGPSKDFAEVRKLMQRAPGLARELLERIADSVVRVLEAQIDAGVQAVQLFDTWAAMLSPSDYATFAAPATERILSALDGRGVPRIIFAGNTGIHRDQLGRLSAEVISVDWRTTLTHVSESAGDRTVQGNLDPCALYAPPDRLCASARAIVDEGLRLPGHVFNLGHGVRPDVDPDQVGRLVDAVHERTPR